MASDADPVASFPAWEKLKLDVTLGKSMYNVYNYIHLLNHVGRLIEKCGDGKSDLDAVDDEFRPHDVTYLKLILVITYARQFLKMGSRHTGILYYLDILSASGLSVVGKKRDPVPGSCFMVPLAHQDFARRDQDPGFMFREVWAFDLSNEALRLIGDRHQCLTTRAGLRLPPINQVPGDANETIQDVVDVIAKRTDELRAARKKRPLTLAFIDNLALNINMQTVAYIQKHIRADLVVHIPTSAIWRCINQYRKGGMGGKALDEFFGSRVWEEADAIEDIPLLYHEAVMAVTGDEFQSFRPVRIKGQNFEFSIGIYVRKTSKIQNRGLAGWLTSIEKLAEACNNVDYVCMRAILDQVLGGQTGLGAFI
jgi:three-Cys-motif partner protein